MIEWKKTVFQRFQNYFSILCKACVLYYFSATLKRLAFNSSTIMCYVMKTKNIKLQKYSTLLLNVPWSPTFLYQMTSQAYNNNVLLFPLQIWKQPHRIKCSDQFRVNKRDTDCFEHLHEENTKPSVNVSKQVFTRHK